MMKRGSHSRLSVAVSGFGLVLASAASLPAAATVSLPGSFEVTETGGAAYTIPIAMPPGTAGMTPSLSLSYNSRGGNGLLGMGWSLTGLPAITRCPKTIAQDGAVGGINYDANDRFCLEGERLVAIGTGTYSANGTEYRTEREAFSKVVSYGTAGTGPQYFKVWTKSGQIMEFGNTADSLIEAQGKTTARLWTLNKVSDTKGNYFTVSYTENNTNGEYRPTRIDYTGNAGAGVTPYASVRFVYETRPTTDTTLQWHAGAQVKTTQRLKNVQTFVGESLVGDYRIAYDQSPATNVSRITSVTLCDPASNCLPATTFAWQAQSGFPWNTPGSPTWGGYNFITGDFNGDGRTDLLLQSKTQGGTSWLYLANEQGVMVYTGFSAPWGGYNIYTGDWNGDGKTDLALMGPTAGYTSFFYHSTGSGFTNTGFNPTNWGGWALAVGDWNGDGKSDILLYHPTSFGAQAWQYNSDGVGGWTYTGFNPTWGGYRIYTGDWNGDGKTDVAVIHPGPSGDSYFFHSTGTGFTSTGFSPTGWAGWELAVGDWNGDGISDFILYRSTVNGTAWMYVGDGTGYFSQTGFMPSWWSGFKIVVGDWNADGKSDVALMSTPIGAYCYFYVSTGDAMTGSIASPQWGGFTLVVGDWNGDGATDTWLVADALGSYATQYIMPYQPDLLTSVTTGLGAVTTITYAPLSQGGTLYTKDATATYPVVDVQAPIYVVSQVATSNGLASGTYQSTYSYAGAKAHAQGRGFLGFRQMTVKDQQTLVEQATNYLQSYPYVGLVDSRVKKLGSTTLNQTQNTYQFLNASNAATLSTPNLTSAPYRVQLQQSVESSWELNGTALPVVTTTYQYDAYGNATQVVVSTPDGYSKTTANTYTNDSTNWLLGRLTRAQVTSTTP
jgi:hypothetical protein